MLDLRAVNNNRFDRAKQLWSLSNLLKGVAFGVGAVSVFWYEPSEYLPYLLVLLVLSSELVQWRSDTIRTRSEALLRKLDLCTSFEREISDVDKRDIVADLPRKLRQRFAQPELTESYFASSEAPGPRRAIENLMESAWYTRAQARAMVWVCAVLIALLTATSIGALIVSAHEVDDASLRAAINRVVTAWLLLIFSLDLFRSAWGYYRLYERSGRSYVIGEHLLTGPVADADALTAWYEYQIARAGSPVLPKWLWGRMKPALDDAWRHVAPIEP